MFYSKPKQILTLGGLRSINRRIFKNSDTVSYLKKQLESINERIDELNKRMLIHYKVEDKIQDRTKVLSDRIDTHMNCFNGSESSHLLYLITESERNINELQLSIEGMKPKDLGTFNFINDKLTQPELDMIEAEAKGESVAREEYDYTSEKKSLAKKVQKMMKLDEDEFINN